MLLLELRPNIRFRHDPPVAGETQEEELTDPHHNTQDESGMEAETINVDIMDEDDTSLFQTGEVRPPREATLIQDEDSEEEDEGEGTRQFATFLSICGTNASNWFFSGFGFWKNKTRIAPFLIHNV